MHQKDYSHAIDEYSRVMSLEPSNVRALYNLGKAYQDSGEVIKARAVWEKALTIDPGDIDVRKALEETPGRSS